MGEQERFERRDALNKIRYEFEEFVRKRIDKVLEEVAYVKTIELQDNVAQQQQIDHLVADFDRLKENLFNVTSAWGRLVSNCVSPNHQESLLRKQKGEEAAEKMQQPPRSSDSSKPPTGAKDPMGSVRKKSMHIPQ